MKLNLIAKLTLLEEWTWIWISFAQGAKLWLSTFPFGANIFTLLCFAVHYAPDPLNNLFVLATRVDRSMHLHFQVHILLISRKSTVEPKALILGGDQYKFCSIIFTTMFRDDGRNIFRKPNLIFRIVTPGIGRQLLIQDGPLGCRLVLLSSTYMGNCVIASTNIWPLQDFCIGHSKVIGKRTSLVRSRILPSPILFKKVTATKNSCSLDDFLVTESSIKQRTMTLSSGRPFVQLVRWNSECPTIFRPRETPLFKKKWK